VDAQAVAEAIATPRNTSSTTHRDLESKGRERMRAERKTQKQRKKTAGRRRRRAGGCFYPGSTSGSIR